MNSRRIDCYLSAHPSSDIIHNVCNIIERKPGEWYLRHLYLTIAIRIVLLKLPEVRILSPDRFARSVVHVVLILAEADRTVIVCVRDLKDAAHSCRRSCRPALWRPARVYTSHVSSSPDRCWGQDTLTSTAVTPAGIVLRTFALATGPLFGCIGCRVRTTPGTWPICLGKLTETIVQKQGSLIDSDCDSLDGGRLALARVHRQLC